MGIQSKQIQWFPGHMAKTRRLISETITSVDAVIELLDARIPASSRNPEIDRLCGDKPRLVLLNKAGLADESITARWLERYTKNGVQCIWCDCVSGEGISRIAPALRELCVAKLEKYAERKDVEMLKKLDIMTCMECGCCAYVCPAKRHLVVYNQLGKQMIKK